MLNKFVFKLFTETGPTQEAPNCKLFYPRGMVQRVQIND